MKKKITLLLALICCMFIATTVYAQEGAKGANARGRRERKTDASIDRRVDRKTDKLGGALKEKTAIDPTKVDKWSEHKSDKMKERRDAVSGRDRAEALQKKAPEIKAKADADASGTISSEERKAYREDVKTTRGDIRESGKQLGTEHAQQYKDLFTKYDSDSDGFLSESELGASSEEFKSLHKEHRKEDIEFLQESSEKRQGLLGTPPAPTEESIATEE